MRGGWGYDTALVDGPIDRLLGVERTRIDHDLAIWHHATADASTSMGPPIAAFDGRVDDSWNSGGYPSHWLEVDLGRPAAVARVVLVAPELPAGATFMLLGRAATADAFRLLYVFKGPTADLQRIDYSPKSPWHGIRYVRLVVPVSRAPMPWVSWRELELYGPTCWPGM